MHPTIPIIDTNNSYVLCINNSFSCIQFKTWFMLHIFSKAYISWHAKTFYYAFICSCVHNISYIFTNAKTHVTCPWYFLLVLNLLLILLLSHLPFYLFTFGPLWLLSTNVAWSPSLIDPTSLIRATSLPLIDSGPEGPQLFYRGSPLIPPVHMDHMITWHETWTWNSTQVLHHYVPWIIVHPCAMR